MQYPLRLGYLRTVKALQVTADLIFFTSIVILDIAASESEVEIPPPQRCDRKCIFGVFEEGELNGRNTSIVFPYSCVIFSNDFGAKIFQQYWLSNVTFIRIFEHADLKT